MIPLLLLSLALTDPNLADANDLRAFASGWLSWIPTKQAEVSAPMNELVYYTDITPNTRTKHTVKAYRPEMVYKTVPVQTVTQAEERVGLEHFADMARRWKGEPNQPAEPNLMDVLQSVTDPNLIESIKELIR